MMNTVKNPTLSQTALQSSLAGREISALDMLGEQLVLSPELLNQNPELAKLIENAPAGTSFDQLLAQLDGESKEDLAASVDPKLLGQMTKNGFDAKSLEIGETNPVNLRGAQVINPKAMPELAEGDDKSILLRPQPNSISNLPTQAKNAEDASRAFQPERKSIFALKQNPLKQNPLKQNPLKQNPLKQNPLDAKVDAQTVSKKQALQNKAQNSLVDFDSFMQRQIPQTKVNLAKTMYANDKADSMFSKKVASETSKFSSSVDQGGMKVSDLMLMQDNSSQTEQGMDFSGQSFMQKPQTLDSSMQVTKTFDLNQLNANQDVINQIQDYIIQAKASSEPSVQMSFQHQDLGVVDLVVQKAQGDQVSIVINSHSTEGAKFFNQNQTELLQSLSQSGVNVADMKLDSSSSSSNNNQENLGQNSRQNPNQQHAGGDRQQREQDSQRRHELWNLLNNKEAA